ncbi:M14 family metallopeptidase [Robertkochia solimangrovi]|uniref:M14 family metallopeptidase n=1 Tax=Robertkochia solimangrovi TaxID=2213046 RepID=UPI003BAFF4D1
MKKIYLLLTLFLHCTLHSQDFTTVFETSEGTETATYAQVIAYYQGLAKKYPSITITEEGMTDSGYPLHLVIYNPNKEKDLNKLRKDHRILLINNGIHPGEPDGIDATMMMLRDFASGKIAAPKHTIIATIPLYNIGGSLNRNSTSRTNQNGPVAYGFRGNARNYDLNRDFIKSDTRNARAFAGIYQKIQPDVFIDNHVSNGADYQYTLTHLFTQHNKLGYEAGDYVQNKMMPGLIDGLQAKSWDITPYVNVFNQVPEKGFSQFLDSPRYSTGYTTLWNTLGMMVETHMLKPYKPRVEGTYDLMIAMIDFTEANYKKILEVRNANFKAFETAATYELNWEVDTTKSRTFDFKGFEGSFIESEVTGQERLYYDRNKPFTRPVEYQDEFKASVSIEIPEAYMIPVGWHNVIDLLKLNGIAMELISQDMDTEAEIYHIEDYKTRNNAYEGHYTHFNTKVRASTEMTHFEKGRYYRVNTRQPGIRYILEVLEPQAVDSFFNWNFFDTILQQKEGFSPYVWEDKANELLMKDSDLKAAFEAKKNTDEAFAKNWYAQLNWLHKHSPNYEKAHLKYPVYRLR